jgi:hypothetical protein
MPELAVLAWVALLPVTRGGGVVPPLPVLPDVRGLTCELKLDRTPTDPVARFETWQAVTMTLSLRNASDEVIKLVVPDGSYLDSVSVLFRLKLTDVSGVRSTLAKFELLREWSLLHSAKIRSLEPGQQLDVDIAMKDWLGWRSAAVPPGDYKMSIAYVGPPVPGLFTKRHRPELLSGTWGGIVSSSAHTIRLTRTRSKLQWQDQENLSAAVELTPHREVYTDGMEFRPLIHVRNLGEHTFVCDRTRSPEDFYWFADNAGKPRLAANGTATMTVNRELIRWTIQPGQQVVFLGFPAKFSNDAGSWHQIDPIPGRYQFVYDLCLRNPDWSHAGPVAAKHDRIFLRASLDNVHLEAKNDRLK